MYLRLDRKEDERVYRCRQGLSRGNNQLVWSSNTNTSTVVIANAKFSRKDQSPFINLVMSVPLRDQNGRIRYWLSSHVDVTCLLRDPQHLGSFRAQIHQEENPSEADAETKTSTRPHPQAEFDDLIHSFGPEELRRLVALGRRKALLAEGVFFKDEVGHTNPFPKPDDPLPPADFSTAPSPSDVFYKSVGRSARRMPTE